jgi:hypothetical protein
MMLDLHFFYSKTDCIQRSRPIDASSRSAFQEIEKFPASNRNEYQESSEE